MPAEDDEMEPPQIAVETLGGDAAEASQEALDLAVAAVDRLDVHGPAHPLAGGAVDALVKNAERRGGGAMAATGVGDEQGVRGDHRRQRPLHAVRVELRQGAAKDSHRSLRCSPDSAVPVRAPKVRPQDL